MQPEDPCWPYSGELDDDWNPVDFRGEPFMPGVRKCGRKDCVNGSHVEGWEPPPADQKPARQPKARAARPARKPRKVETRPRNIGQEYYDRILQAATEGLEKSTYKLRPGVLCNMPDCLAPYKAKGLCATHYAVYRRVVSPEKLKTLRRVADYTLEDFAGMTTGQPQTGQCTVPNCHQKMNSRSLCRNHVKVWRKFIRGEK